VTIPVLTAVTGAGWESRLVAALENDHNGLEVARRCVDVADLLAAVAAGHGRAVLLSADLRRLDREILGRLAAAEVAVVGVVPVGDEQAERRLRQLGVEHVLTAEATPAEVSAQVRQAIDGISVLADAGVVTRGDGRDALRDVFPDSLPTTAGRLVAVWGPTGSPGRTTIAVNVAAEAARLGRTALLADADTYGGAVAQVLGLLDEAPGLAGATRAANSGQLDLPALARHARQVTPRLRVLTGITRTERWPEIRPASLEVVWALARGLAEITVVDCGFCLEQDEELSFDTAAPRRNGAVVTTLEHADVVVAVGSADPLGLQRLVRGLSDLRELVPGAEVRVVVNRLRSSVVGVDPERQVRRALERYAGVIAAAFVPEDRTGLDAALLRGQTLAEAAPKSAARQAIAALATDLVGADKTARATKYRRLGIRARARN
jgi:MinD-like ATPase involved in chromosome partitioning or flagellar assembly